SVPRQGRSSAAIGSQLRRVPMQRSGRTRKIKVRKPPAQSDGMRVVGTSRLQLRTVYHAFLVASWPAALFGIVVAYLGLNACFAVAYWLSDGIAEARPGSFADAFYFSIQTMGTIG